MDIKKMLNRGQALNKKGTLTDGEIKHLVRTWHNSRLEEELNHVTIEIEMKAMEEKLIKYNVEQTGDTSHWKGKMLCKLGDAKYQNSSNRMADLQI
jgi:hypothetical protein